MAREAKAKQESQVGDQEQPVPEQATDAESKAPRKTVPPGVSGELLGRAIWRESVIKAKGEKLEESAREAQWKADRKEYIGMGRRIVGRLNQHVRRRSKEASS